jgi:tetratricopeptide (TPR) repeat protein
MKLTGFTIFLMILMPVLVQSQDLQQLQKEATAAEATLQDEQAFQKYQQINKLQPADIAVLCKCSELACKIGNRHAAKETQIKYYTVARRYAEQALQLNAAHADANFVMSLAMGRMALVSGGRTQVEAVKGIKIYADKTIQLNPADYRGYHVLGKWNYEIANLGAFKRTAVKLFYGAFPDASFDQAKRYYQKSVLLNPGFNLNYLELAKVYVKLDQQNQAIACLQKLLVMPIKMEDDQRIYTEGRNILKSLQQKP